MKHPITRVRRLTIAVLGIWLPAILATAALPACAQIVEVGDGSSGPLRAGHLTAELVTQAPQIASGGQLKIGLSLTLDKHWHVYWINAGDSGEPPAIRWTLPTGLTVTPLQFPSPQRLPLGPLMDFGYENQVVFPMTLTATSKTRTGKVHLDAHVAWLVCSRACIPGKAHLGLDLRVVRAPAPQRPLTGALGSAVSKLPRPLPAGMYASATGDAMQIVFTLRTTRHSAHPEFYSFDQEVIQNAANPVIERPPHCIRFRVQRATDSIKLPPQIHALIKLSDTEAYETTVPLKTGVTVAVR
jgi:thiol:disulfide interchange protein DsbD